MKKFILIVSVLLISIFSNAHSVSEVKRNEQDQKLNLPDTSLHVFHFISKKDAENIIGQSVILKDSIWKIEGGIYKFRCDYNSALKDTSTKQFRRLEFIFENYKQISEAKRFFDLMKIENEKNSVVNNVDHLGDDAFLTKDVEGNPFIMIRVNAKIFKLRTLNCGGELLTEKLKALANNLIFQ